MGERRRVESKRLRKSSVALTREAQAAAGDLGDVGFVTEGVRAEQLSERHWELHVAFSIYNLLNADIYVYDIHAEEYECNDRALRPGDIFHVRAAIALYSDNSILQDNRVYEVTRGRVLPVDLALSISRTPVGGIYYVFGLFVDYHFGADDGVRRRRVASECLYVFDTPPTTFLHVDHGGNDGATGRILTDLKAHRRRSGPL